MKTLWKYLVNVFLIITADSFRLALRISVYHYSALKSKIAEPFILGLFNAYELKHSSYVSNYKEWKKQLAKQRSKTLALNKLLKTLSGTKARFWDSSITKVYDKGTVEYEALLADGRAPFQTSSQTERVEAVGELIEAIGTDLLLADVKIDVEAFYLLLNTALTEQKGAMSDTETKSGLLETARIAMCVAQYKDLGMLMGFYSEDPTQVEEFFDLRAIRNGKQVLFQGQVKKNSFKFIVERTFAPGDKLSLENDGVTELRFYIGNSNTATIGATFITVAVGEIKEITASELGDVSTLHYLLAFNPDAVNKGEFTVEVV